jgi:dihydropteroate synthase
MTDTPSVWRVTKDRVLTLDRPRLLGILNVTPDSFSDGGAFATVDQAVSAALRMRHEGACIIDVGGESTRPGSKPVDAKEQVRRTIPVIESLRDKVDRNDLLISIDTTRSEVACAALDAGADIINDVSAGRDDAQMLALAALRGCGLILMHRLTSPASDVYSSQYVTAPDYGGDVVAVVRAFLDERAKSAVDAGVDSASIVIDPGLGFGKSVAQNYELIGRIGELAELNHPVLSAASRKSFLAAATGEAVPARRDNASVAVTVAHWMMGVRLFRVHNVAAHAQALAVAIAIQGALEPDSLPATM